MLQFQNFIPIRLYFIIKFYLFYLTILIENFVYIFKILFNQAIV